jgi:hypothetical protein
MVCLPDAWNPSGSPLPIPALLVELVDMVRMFSPFKVLSLASIVTAGLAADRRAADPCVAIANQTWVAPADVRACYQSFKVNATEK